MKARVFVTLKNGVLDPQGKAIRDALARLAFAEVHEVRAGRRVEVELAATDAAAAGDRLRQMCEKLLANPVVEDYEIELIAPEAP